ncbi:aromatic amino acid beta-eliminating lyase/threonine aldolase [Candidatus Vecturithrix granuli]|uniref:Aromatic amino acid beta-eliminating lyase/threonine aldolase n=1 Tax=Vecturithrix granuli TaxID=1499967 RepID=A0A0S6W626_VECG1|nr:aromatic amino acid beta-eliminating lyase/threonine aldolase [Candidatus Vecturithrix granuli]
MKVPKHFASDNFAGVHPDILKAIASANSGHYKAYGADKYTDAAIKKFHDHFGDRIDVYFVFGGTAANVLGLKMITESYHGIVCAESAHINVDECGAPEKFTGCKLLTVPSPDGKITVEQVSHFLSAFGVEHHNQPKVISITQTTEMGTVYTPEEIETLAAYAHQHDMLLHVDGARLANAAASLDLHLSDLTTDVGVDVLSFGGTKNGLMFGEAVIFFKRSLSKNFKYLRKQGMQLLSKMRFISAQFDAYLSNDLWLKNARHANAMAQLLASELEKIPTISITQKVQANAVFAIFPKEIIPTVQEKYYFYVWNEHSSEVRLMTSFDTTKKEVKGFVEAIKDTLKQK